MKGRLSIHKTERGEQIRRRQKFGGCSTWRDEGIKKADLTPTPVFRASEKKVALKLKGKVPVKGN